MQFLPNLVPLLSPTAFILREGGREREGGCEGERERERGCEKEHHRMLFRMFAATVKSNVCLQGHVVWHVSRYYDKSFGQPCDAVLHACR